MVENVVTKRRKGREGDLDQRPEKEFEEVLLEVRRVTRVTTGGRQLSFRAIVLIGNKKGRIALGVAKGADVSIAVKKATHEAYKNIVEVPITENASVPYEIVYQYKSAKIKLLPAAPGTGLKAGSSVRIVLSLAGYMNILSKIMGTNNKLNNAIAAIQALASFKKGKFTKKKENIKNEKPENKKDTSKKTDATKEKKIEKKTTAKKTATKKTTKKTTPSK